LGGLVQVKGFLPKRIGFFLQLRKVGLGKGWINNLGDWGLINFFGPTKLFGANLFSQGFGF